MTPRQLLIDIRQQVKKAFYARYSTLYSEPLNSAIYFDMAFPANGKVYRVRVSDITPEES